jgi:branched-chain amino acid transport system substrate-binding protein
MAKSTDANSIIEALENWKGGTSENPYSYRKSDHQMMLKNLVVEVKPKITDQWDYFDVKGTVPNHSADLDKVFGESGCHMTAS